MPLKQLIITNPLYFGPDCTPEPPSISTIPRSRPLNHAPKPENGPRLVDPSHAPSSAEAPPPVAPSVAGDDLNVRIPPRQTPSPCLDDANYSTPVAKVTRSERLA